MLQRHTQDLIFLRGPVIGALIVLSVLIPTLLKLSWIVLIRGALFLVAFCLAIHDGTRLLLKYSRRTLQRSIQNIVLDDVLCAIFHPQTGILSVMGGMFLGNAALYSLPTTPEQRVHLVQHALDGTGMLDQNNNSNTGEKIPAQEILLEPGGFLRLAPAAVQDWFRDAQERNDESDQGEEPQKAKVVSTLHSRKREEDENSTASETSSICFCQSDNEVNAETHAGSSPLETPVRPPPEDDTVVRKRQTVGSPNWNPPHYDSQSPATRRTASTNTTASAPRHLSPRPSHQQQHHHTLPMPHEIVGSILQDWTAEHVQRFFRGVPDGSLETICLTATTLLCLQFRYSRRARDLLWSSLQASAAVGGSTALIAAILALVTKHRVMSSGNCSDGTALHTSNTAQTSNNATTTTWGNRNAVRAATSTVVWSSLRSLAKSGLTVRGCLKKWQGVLAAIVLFYFGGRRRHSSTSSGS